MPRPLSRFWSDWTARDFADLQHSPAADRAVAVLPEPAMGLKGVRTALTQPAPFEVELLPNATITAAERARGMPVTSRLL